MLPMLLAIAQEATHESGASAGPFSVSFGLIFWTWVVFIGLLIVLSKFAWPAILKATEEREAKVRQQLAQAEEMNLQAKALLDEQRKLTAEARASAQALLADAKAAVEQERAHALEKIKQDQDSLMDRARRDIGIERDKAIAELRREAVDLALGAASKVIGQRLDSDVDRRIVMDYVANVERSR